MIAQFKLRSTRYYLLLRLLHCRRASFFFRGKWIFLKCLLWKKERKEKYKKRKKRKTIKKKMKWKLLKNVPIVVCLRYWFRCFYDRARIKYCQWTSTSGNIDDVLEIVDLLTMENPRPLKYPHFPCCLRFWF